MPINLPGDLYRRSYSRLCCSGSCMSQRLAGSKKQKKCYSLVFILAVFAITPLFAQDETQYGQYEYSASVFGALSSTRDGGNHGTAGADFFYELWEYWQAGIRAEYTRFDFPGVSPDRTVDTTVISLILVKANFAMSEESDRPFYRMFLEWGPFFSTGQERKNDDFKLNKWGIMGSVGLESFWGRHGIVIRGTAYHWEAKARFESTGEMHSVQFLTGEIAAGYIYRFGVR